MCLILVLNRTHSLVRQCALFFSGKQIRMLNINCFFHIVRVTTDVIYPGLSPWVISLTSVLRGAVVFVQFGIYRIPHTVICCLLFVSAYLYLTNYVVVQSTVHAHAYRMSHNSSVRLRRIVYTLHAVIHQWVWIYYSVPIDFKLILMVSLMVLLITLFIRITIVP